MNVAEIHPPTKSSRTMLDGLPDLLGSLRPRSSPESHLEPIWHDTAHLQDGIDKAAAVTRRLAHDFCNILTSLLGFAELSVLQLPEDTPARHYIEEVLDSAAQGAAWSQKLQIFSQRSEQRFVPADVAKVLAEESPRPCWREQVTLTIDLPARLPTVAMDKESLRQILAALLDNAREALQGKGGVTVSAKVVDLPADAEDEILGSPLAGPHIELAISDTGVGLTPEARDRLFREIFFTTKGRRRGLGLAIVYGILRGCHGGFQMFSNADRGVTVRVYLPASGVRSQESGVS